MYQVFVKGYVGNLGTKVLIDSDFNELSKYFDAGYLHKIKDCVNGGVNPPLFIVYGEGECGLNINSIKDSEKIGKGGFLASLWKICDRNKCGLRYSLLKVPILQGTIEICNYLDLNPYRLITEDAEILFVECSDEETNGMSVSQETPISLIGETTSDKKRIRIDNDKESYLTKDFKDEIDKIIKGYTKNYG